MLHVDDEFLKCKQCSLVYGYRDAECKPPISLTEPEEAELKRLKSHFPYRKCAAVKTADGKVEYFAKATLATANNYARKNIPAAIFIL